MSTKVQNLFTIPHGVSFPRMREFGHQKSLLRFLGSSNASRYRLGALTGLKIESTFQKYQPKVQIKVTPAYSTHARHSSPKYRPRVLPPSSTLYNRSGQTTVCNVNISGQPKVHRVNIPAHSTGQGYRVVTHPAHGTRGQASPQYAPSEFQPTVQATPT